MWKLKEKLYCQFLFFFFYFTAGLGECFGLWIKAQGIADFSKQNGSMNANNLMIIGYSKLLLQRGSRLGKTIGEVRRDTKKEGLEVGFF